MSSLDLTPLCTTFQTAVSEASAALTELWVYHPEARRSLMVLYRELSELGLVTQLLGQNGEVFDRSEKAIPAKVLETLKAVIQNADLLVAEVKDAADTSDEPDTEGEHGDAWLEHTVERLTPLGRLVENARIGMNLGLDALLFATNLGPAESRPDLPPYDISQILQKSMHLRTRLRRNSDTDDHRVSTQRQAVTALVDAVQEFIEQTSPSTSVPQMERSAPRTDVSSLHSEMAIPDYNAIGITNPTPLTISLRHMVKKELSNHEVVQVSFLTRHDQPTIAVSTLEPPTRFFDTAVNPVSSLSNQHGVHMLFSPDGRTWAYLCEEDARDLNSWSHDGVTFKKPVVHLGDYLNGGRIQKMRWPGARPFGFSPDGRWLAVGSARGRIALIDVKGGAVLDRATVVACHLDEVTHATFTPDSRTLVSQSRDGTIRLTDPETRASIAKLETDTWKKPLFLGALPNNDVIVSVWGDTVFHWNHRTAGVESYNLSSRRRREGWPIAVSQDCRFLCCRTDDGVDLSDLHSGTVLYTIKFQSGFVTTAAFSADGRYLVLGKAAAWMGARVSMSTLDVWELIF